MYPSRCEACELMFQQQVSRHLAYVPVIEIATHELLGGLHDASDAATESMTVEFDKHHGPRATGQFGPEPENSGPNRLSNAQPSRFKEDLIQI